ncbi:MAG: HAD family hydrolase [Deltaproteobacteria bacterium]|nr:HAD family hydrolase [Deltaproteobacteria bacterium]
MARIRAVLFDVDGTLLDSNDAHARAWLDVLRGHGRELPFDLIREKIGKGGDKLLMEVAQLDDESPEGKLIVERRVAVLKAHYLPDLGPLPGARTLVDRLRSQGFTCCVVTSANQAELADLLRAAAVADLFEHTITSDDAERSKPDPDLVKAALDKVGVGPREAVMIGDTPYDVAAAARAGVATIAFRSGGWSDRDLDGAVAIYDGPQDLSTRLAQSPLALGVADDFVPAAPVSRGRARRVSMRGV